MKMARQWRSIARLLGIGCLLSGFFACDLLAQTEPSAADAPNSRRVRFATFNTSLFRSAPGELIAELSSGTSESARQIAEVIQIVRPDVLLLNEVDYDDAHRAVYLLQKEYLSHGQNGQPPIDFAYSFTAPVNTGVDSKHDLNRNGKLGEPDDAFGFGKFPGQYGMVVLSRFPIGEPRTFQMFLWKDMPRALWPVIPETNESYYSPEIQSIFRLSSKSHWVVPIQVGQQTIQLVAAHPTPPVFDGAEDRNGCRNHDEIRLIADIVSGADYLYDDQGNRGGLRPEAMFVIVGDMNADPNDGASRESAARQITEHPLVNGTFVPKSTGALRAAESSGQANRTHRGDAAADTGDFNDQSVGNLRIDYVLPSKNLAVVGGGVFWPPDDDPHAELARVSDHHLVWIDMDLDESNIKSR